MRGGKKIVGVSLSRNFTKIEKCLNCGYSEKHPRKNIKVYKMACRIKEL